MVSTTRPSCHVSLPDSAARASDRPDCGGRRSTSLASVDCSIAHLGALRKCIAQLRARGDLELGKDPVEMRTDRAAREEQPLADLPVGESLGGQRCDLHFLRCEPVTCVRCAMSDGLARGAEFLSGADAPPGRSERVEYL